jgi:hypothetical protein
MHKFDADCIAALHPTLANQNFPADHDRSLVFQPIDSTVFFFGREAGMPFAFP